MACTVKNSFRGDDISYRDRYFNATEDGFALQDRVRERISFPRRAILLDPALTNHTAYDFVFCRNLLIYFDQPTQKHVFEVLKRLTRDDGHFCLSDPPKGSLVDAYGDALDWYSPRLLRSVITARRKKPVALLAEPSPRSAIVPPGFNPRSVSRTPPRPNAVSLASTQRSSSVATEKRGYGKQVKTTLRHCLPPSPALPTKAKVPKHALPASFFLKKP